MEEKKTKFLEWVKSHKKQLILAGISITAIMGIVLRLKNNNNLMKLWESLEKSIKKEAHDTTLVIPTVQGSVTALETLATTRTYTPPQAPFDVSQHIRNMSGGRHHSAEKAAEAAALGITLLPNQTLINTHTKYAAA